jgi:hypothetical protein
LRRCAAYLLDLAVVQIVSALTYYLWQSWVLTAIVVVQTGIIVAFLIAATGAAIGGRIVSIYMVKAGTIIAPGSRQAPRALIFGLLHLTAIGPLITLLTTRDGRDWIDRLVGTACSTTRRPSQAHAPARAFEAPPVSPPARQPLPPPPLPPPPTGLPVGFGREYLTPMSLPVAYDQIVYEPKTGSEARFN